MASDTRAFWRFDHHIGISCDADPGSNSLLQVNASVDVAGVINLGTGANRITLVARNGQLIVQTGDAEQ